MKENDLAHGEFDKWLENLNLDWNTANKFMRVTAKLNSNVYTYTHLAKDLKLFKYLAKKISKRFDI